MNGPDQGDKAFPIDRVRARPDDPGRRPARRRHLPSLGSFATFEVAAKHLSFTLAASELNVTQAAISQHIRGLEKALGCKLFLRKHNAIELTSEGETLLEAVTSGLDRLSDAIGQLGRGDENATVTIAGTYAGASHYLKPMADAYRALHPEARGGGVTGAVEKRDGDAGTGRHLHDAGPRAGVIGKLDSIGQAPGGGLVEDAALEGDSAG